MAVTLISVILVTSAMAGVAFGDAGSGGDAGGTTATSIYLPANNSTYYGNLTQGSDTDDYYAINMSSGTGLAVTISIPSNVDFDLILLASSGATIDSSTNGTGISDHVTSNGTSVGGTTVYIWVDQYSGSGQYTMQVDIFSAGSGSGGGGGIGNDAGSGQDAGNSMSSALSLNMSNITYFEGNLSTINDDDWYSFYVPVGYGAYFEMTHDSSADFDMWLYDSNGSEIDEGYTGNIPETVGTNGTNVSNSIIYLEVKDWPTSPSSGAYNISLDVFSIVGLPVYNQNDAGSGGDAADDIYNATNLTTPSSGSGSFSFSSWMSSDDDPNDFYQFYVPLEHGADVSLSSYPNVTGYLLLGWASNSTVVDTSYNYNGNEYVSSNGSNVSGQDLIIRAVATSGEGFYNFTVNIFSLDTDGDGWMDTVENSCGTDPQDYNSTPSDFDSDGICDTMDADDDNDGTPDNDDAFRYDATEWDDTDSDGIGDNADEDDDGDGWGDDTEGDCGTDPLAYSSQPSDIDGDTICNALDDDDDGDGYPDSNDDFPLDDTEWLDTDNDGIGNNIDENDDADGFSDYDEIICGSDPLSYSSVPDDSDSDGICDIVDTDDDDDGFPDDVDDFPFNPQEWIDTDSDGQGDNSDFDDDNDGVIDEYDAFDTDPSEQYDNDMDGLGNNIDQDDDNDGWLDSDESTCLSDPLDSAVLPDDFDSDQICDIMDADDDGDGYPDLDDAFQYDASEWDDTDSDGVGNNADEDDDGDGWPDTLEPNCGADPIDPNSRPSDSDGDGSCNFLDPDDDNDSVNDLDDDFPLNPNEARDTDGDGIGDNADNDDDGDGWTDSAESLCDTSPLSQTSVPLDTDEDGTCDMLDMDDDNDGVPDSGDLFPKDELEWEDANNDGLGDNGNPLSLIDKMELNPGITALALIAILAAVGAVAYVNITRNPEGPLSRLIKREDSYPSDGVTSVITHGNHIPPVPHGFEDTARDEGTYAKTWESLPAGGEYTETEPMMYVGEICGTWEQQEDDSWIRI